MSKVNLDALIPRDDLAIKEEEISSSTGKGDISETDLKNGAFFLNALRKPDFQRETNEWNPERVCGLIKSFLDGNLIPAVILWASDTSRNTFIIDGAHRLSALIAWINDDYGDSSISRAFFGVNIPDNQIKLAEKTRKLIKKEIGAYQDYVKAVQLGEERAEKKFFEGAKKLGSLNIKVQWVPGNAKSAEESFFKINSAAAPIDATERKLLESRQKPYAIAARAIIHSGTGHKYWSKFQDTIKQEIEKLSKEISDLLFIPDFNPPVKTLDVPLAGKGYSAHTLELILNLVCLSNNINVLSPKNKKGAQINIKDVPNDNTGENTIEYLKQTKKITNRICGKDSSSLGLHPMVYFYSIDGRYQVTPFLATIELIKFFEEKDYYYKFTSIRKLFEDFIVKHKVFIKQITYTYGSGLKSYLRIFELFVFIIECLVSNKNEQEILELLKSDERFKYLDYKEPELTETTRKEFTDETKSAVYIKSALATPNRCAICEGYMHVNSISIDHAEDKKYGGLGNVDNGQLSHFYCNTGYKNKKQYEVEKQDKEN